MTAPRAVGLLLGRSNAVKRDSTHGASRMQLGSDRPEDRFMPSTTPLDLTMRGSEGTIEGAVFQQCDAQPTGTGVIQSFVRVQTANAKSSVEQGYNTDGRPLQFDE